MSDPVTNEPVDEPAAPTPPNKTVWSIEMVADGVVTQGTSPFPVEQNKDHL